MKSIILVIDDQPVMVKALKKQLEQIIDLDKFEIVECVEVERAFDVIIKSKSNGEEIPLIICDFVMPEMDGAEFLKKAHKILPSALKVLLSAKVNLDEIASEIDYESLFKFVKKPWTKSDLNQLVDSALRIYYNEENKSQELIHLKDELLTELSDILEDKRLKMNLAFESCKFYLWEWLIEEDILHYDGNLLNLLGYNSNILTNITSLLSLIHLDDKKAVLNEIHKITSNQTNSISIKCRIKKQNGEYIWIETNGVTYKNNFGKYVLSAISQDIHNVHKNQIKVIENEFLFRTFFEKMSAGAIISQLEIIDNQIVDIICLDANQQMQQFIETDRNRLIGKSLIKTMNNTINPQFFNFINLVHKTNESHYIQSSFIFNNKHTGILAFPFPNCNDKIALIINDLTERYNWERNIQIAKKQADESLKMKNSFISNISHEIRTPMNQILGFAELLKDPSFAIEDKNNFAEIIYDKSKKLMKMINEIIDISKLESSDFEFEYNDVSIESLFLELYYHYNELIKNSGKEISLHYEMPSIKIIKSDYLRLKQVMLNLLENALKFTNEGKIIYGFNQKDSEIEFFVEDTGIGFDEQSHQYIFNPFNQLDESYTKQYEGIGLGLNLSKTIVEKLGGKIYAKSKENIGSKFFFTLPLIENKNDISINQLFSKVDNINMLLISNSEEEIVKLENIAKNNNINLHTICESIDCSDLIIDKKINIIFVDLMYENNFSSIYINKYRNLNSALKFVAITSISEQANKINLMNNGFDSVIRKPIDLVEFTRQIYPLI